MHYCNYLYQLMLVIIFIGNHTFAAIRGTESYSLLSSLTDVMSNINAPIEKPVLDGKKLRVLFGGDYKVVNVN